MKKLSFFFLAAALLALIPCACNNPSTASSPVATDNGVYYWADAGGGRNVIVAIVDPAAFSRAVEPKSGFWYAIWLVYPSEDSSEPVTMGTISVNGETITFNPFTDMSYTGGSFTGTLSGSTLVLDSIPGIFSSQVTLEDGGSFRFYDDDPAGSLPFVPESDDESTPGSTRPTTGTPFNAGRYVTDVVFVTRPTATTAYEGYPVDLTGMVVEIHYNNGDVATKTAANANEFTVDPPVYETDYCIHTIQYIAEYFDPATAISFSSARQFRAPLNDPPRGFYFYEILDGTTELPATAPADKRYYEGVPFSDYSGVSVKVTYSNGAKTITPTSVYKTSFIPGPPGVDPEVWVHIGRHYIVIPIKETRIIALKGVAIEKQPDFSEQLILDDPRFFSGQQDLYWLSKLKNSSFRLLYSGDSTIKYIGVLEAYSANRLLLEYPTTLSDKEAKLKYTFKGDNLHEFTVIQTFPVYNRLVNLVIVPIEENILLKGSGPLAPDNEQSLLRMIKIRAIYQQGSDKSRVVMRDDVLIRPSTANPYISVQVDSDLINASPIATNVHTGTGGILTSSNSKSFDSKGKLAKARITFTTFNGNDSSKTGSSYSRTAVIEIGVTGY